MLQFQYISGKNIVTYKSFHYDFTAGALQIIRGQNRSGKSLIFSTLGSILYNAAVLDRRRGSSRHIHSTDSAMEVAVINSTGTWRLCQLGSGKEIIYNVFHDGQELRPTRATEARKVIDQVITVPEDLFYTINLLNPDRNHPLLNSKPGIRHDYFESGFDLGIYDLIHQHLLSQVGSIKSAATVLAQLQQRHDELSEEKDKLPPKAQYDQIVADWRSLQQQHNLRIKQAQSIAVWLAIAETIKSKDSPQIIAQELQRIQMALPKLQQRWQEARRQLSDYQAYSKHHEQLLELHNELQKLPNNELAAVQQELDIWQHRQNLLNSLLPLLREFIEKEKTWRPVAKIILPENVQAELLASRNLLHNLQRISGPHCPTCGHTIDKITLQQMQQTLRSKIEKLTEQTAQATRYQENLLLKKRLYELQQNIVQTKDGRYYFDNRQQLAKLDFQIQEKLRDLSVLAEAASRRQELLQQQTTLTNIMPKNSQPISEELVQTMQQDYENLQQRYNFLHNELQLHEKLAQTGDYGDPVNVRQYYTQLQQQLERDGTSLNSLQQELQTMRDKLTRHNLRTQELQKLRHKITELQVSTTQSEIYEHLLLAYGSKGLRINMVQNLVEVWLANMNNNAHFIFAEPYRFSVDIDVNRFIILAERSGGIAEIASTLSGSERSCFALLNMLVLPELLPNRYRSNIAILDEAEAHLDNISLQLFATDFLPRLAAVVPHITVVTPKTMAEFSVPDARELSVIKERGISQLHGA